MREQDLHAYSVPNGVPTTVLTLHQPLASLMVYGLKRVEGRVWNSAFRGPLWIHAASKEPTSEEIAEGEAFYRAVFAEDGVGAVQFPKMYPTSAVLGLVDVVNVTTAHEFLSWSSLSAGARLEGRANGADYFFLCEKAQRLVLPFAHTGQHKLWSLDGAVAKRAMAALQPCEQMPISFEGHAEVSRALADDSCCTASASMPATPRPGSPEDVNGDSDDEEMLRLVLALSLSDQAQLNPVELDVPPGFEGT